MESHVYIVRVLHGADFDKQLAHAAYLTREEAETKGATLLQDCRDMEEPEWQSALRAEITPVPFG